MYFRIHTWLLLTVCTSGWAGAHLQRITAELLISTYLLPARLCYAYLCQNADFELENLATDEDVPRYDERPHEWVRF
jgi:hypothetical protein